MDYTSISKIYLASKSPRRRELLTQIGVDYRLLTIDVPEIQAQGEHYLAYSRRVCQAKAVAAAEYLHKNGLELLPILTADTEVVLDDRVLGKPDDYQHAFAMLESLAGQKHLVLTSLTLKHLSFEKTLTSSTWVYFDDLSAADIHAYLARGDYLDKAGGYGIQSFAGQFVQKIEGCFYGVMGLPLNLVKNLLVELSLHVN